MPADLSAIVADLAAEQDDLDSIVAALAAPDWALATPAEGWTVHDSVAHLAHFDGRAVQALTDPAGFAAHLEEVMADPAQLVEHHLDEGRAMRPATLLDAWREVRARLAAALLATDPAQRIPWYGPAMSPASFATARLMETWCHGQDVVDATGVERVPTARLRHVAHIAIKARPFNYMSHGMPLPAAVVGVALRAPDGSTWTWNTDAADRVSGDALDFALVVTQRRHLVDTALEVEGPLAAEWMAIAQAFAGPPGPGRRPGQFARRRSAAST